MKRSQVKMILGSSGIVVELQDQLQNKFPILLGLDWQIQTIPVGFANPTGANLREVISSIILIFQYLRFIDNDSTSGWDWHFVI